MDSVLSRGRRRLKAMDPEVGLELTADARVSAYISVRFTSELRLALTCPLTRWQAAGALLLRALAPLLPPRYSPRGRLSWWWWPRVGSAWLRLVPFRAATGDSSSLQVAVWWCP
jgi:hypothetical protein